MIRLLRMVFAVALLIGVAVGVAPLRAAQPAFACDCEPADLTERAPHSDLAVRGRVVEVDRAGLPSSDVAMEIEVTHLWHGDDKNPVRVYTASSGPSCGLEWAVDDDVLVLGTRDGTKIRVMACDGSGPATPERVDEVVAVLGEARTPTAFRPGSPVPAVPIGVAVAVLAIAGVLVVIVVRWRRAQSAGSE